MRSPRHPRRTWLHLRCAVLIPLALGIAGCGSGAKFYASDLASAGPLTDAQARNASAGAASKIVVLRWPALIVPEARAAVVANDHKWLGVSMAPSVQSGAPPFAAAPDLVESASTLFTAELYWAIKRLDPTVTVLLEPQAVIRERNGQILMRSLVDPSIPVDLAVDHWAKTLSWQMTVSQSFNLAIQTAPSRSPGNCGLLMASVGNQPLPRAYDKVSCTSSEPRNALQSNFLLDGEQRPDVVNGVRYRLQLPFSRDEVVLLRTVGYVDGGPLSATMNDYVKNSRPQRLSDADSVVVHSTTEFHARLVVSALGTPSAMDAQGRTMATYVRMFDPELADTLDANRSLDPTQAANLELVKRLLRQEYQIRAKRDERIAREIVAGDFGQRFRAARDAAYSAYGTQMMKTWAGTFGAIALHGAALQATGPGLGSLSASNQAVNFFNQQQEAAGVGYIKEVAPSLNLLGQTTVSMVGDNAQVEVGDQAGLRTALQRLYSKYRQ